AQLAQGCRSLKGDERFRHFFSNLEQLEQLVKERSQALAGDNQQYAEESAKVDQVIAANQAQINAMNAELITRSQKLSEQQQLLTRAEGLYKRLLIEIRSLKSAEEEGRIQGKPVDHGTRIAALMEQVPNHQAAVAKRTADRSAVQAHVDAARKEVDRFTEEGRRLHKQKAEFEKSFRQRLGVRSQGVEEAEKEILAEGAHIARGLLSQRGGIAIPEEALDAVRTADAEVLREMKTQRLLEMALTAYDHNCYKQGRNFIIAAVVVLVMIVVIKVVGSHQPDESDDSSSESSRITCVELQRPV
ncbi:MAG TPA: hypothetical protein VL137_11445, partial [Polyangiaceae bacterium]|nr:hypothetical protein [Polyangiaceae bacterium]